MKFSNKFYCLKTWGMEIMVKTTSHSQCLEDIHNRQLQREQKAILIKDAMETVSVEASQYLLKN